MIEFDIEIYKLGETLTMEGNPNDPEDAFYLQRVDGLDGPDITSETQTSANGTGDLLSTAGLRGREFLFEGKIKAPTRVELRAKQNELREHLYIEQFDYPLPFSVTGGTLAVGVRNRGGDPVTGVFSYGCQLSQRLRMVESVERGSHVVDFSFGVRSEAPVLSGGTTEVVEISANVPGDVENDGNAPAPWSATVHGPGTGFTLYTGGFGAYLDFPALTLSGGEHFEIYNFFSLRRILGSDASYADLDRATALWRPVMPGTNSVILSVASGATAATKVEFSARNGYW